jgi:hypothetical protein
MFTPVVVRLGSCSLSPAGSRPSPLRRGAVPPGRVDGVPAVKWSLLQSGSRLLPCPARRGGGAPASSPNPEQTGRWWKRNPQEGVGGLASVPHRPAPFESTPRAARGGKSPPCPWPFAGQGRWRSRPRLGGASDARWRGSGVFSLSPRSNPTPRARAGPRRARRLGGLAAPRPACWCGETGGARPARLTSAGVKRRGKGGEER